jgi:heme O synthase-like polyprenyltransferase
MEAEAGIEPANVGFANRCLTTWPLRLDETSSCAAKLLSQSGLVVVAMLSLVNCTIVELLLYGVTCQSLIFCIVVTRFHSHNTIIGGPQRLTTLILNRWKE